MLKTILTRLRNAVKVTGLILLALILIALTLSLTRWIYYPPNNDGWILRSCRYTGYAEVWLPGSGYFPLSP